MIVEQMKSTPKNIQRELQSAIECHNNGHMRKAEKAFRSILRVDPNHGDCNHWMGLVLCQNGKAKKAIPFLIKALPKSSAQAPLFTHLGGAYREVNQPKKAIEYYRKALEIEPGNAPVHEQMGMTFHDLGLLQEALECYQRAIEIEPENAETYHNLGQVFVELGKHTEAIEAFRKAIYFAPELAMAHFDLACLLADLGQLESAVEIYHNCIKLQPDLAIAYHNLGNVYCKLSNPEKGENILRQALELLPTSAITYNSLALALSDQGLFSEAEENFRRAVDLKPDYGGPYLNLANIRRLGASTNDIESLEKVFRRKTTSDDDKMHMAFGLGKAFEYFDKFDKAFEYYAIGNTLKRQAINFSIGDQESYYGNLEHAFDPVLFNRYVGSGSQECSPIFILGMPRSGTSLVEQILSSHSEIQGCGELVHLGAIVSNWFPNFPQGLEDIDFASLEKIGNEYLNSVGAAASEQRHFTDKLPSNYQYIGLIKTILPNAKIIHCQRNAADNCLSLFKPTFPIWILNSAPIIAKRPSSWNPESHFRLKSTFLAAKAWSSRGCR